MSCRYRAYIAQTSQHRNNRSCPHDYSSQQASYDTGRIDHDPPLPRKSLENTEPYQKHLYQQPSNLRIESTPRSDDTPASAAAIAAAITDSISMSRLPVPDPVIFKGETIEYSDCHGEFGGAPRTGESALGVGVMTVVHVLVE